MKKGLIITIIIIALLVGGVLALRFYLLKRADMASTKMQQQFGPPTVEVTKGEVNRVVFASGTVKERQRQEVDAEGTTKVTQVMVQEGQQVKAGDALFVLDNDEVEMALRRERLDYQIKEREYNKESRTVRGSIILADASGTISELELKEGMEVTEDTVVATIKSADLLTVNAAFNSQVVSKLSIGMKGRFFINEFLQYVDGKIVKIDKKGTANTAGAVLYNVKFEIPNPGALSPGLEGFLEFKTPAGETIRSFDKIPIQETEPVQIKAGVRGEVKAVKVSNGDMITAGDILATLDNSEAVLSLEDKRLGLEQAQLSLQAKEKEAQKYVVRAPVDGIISELEVEVGKVPPADKPDVIMAGNKGLVLQVNIDETDIGSLELEQGADVFLNAFGEKRFQGTLVEIEDRGNQEEGAVAFKAEILLSDAEKVKVGMTGDAEIKIATKKDVLALPINAVEIIDQGVGQVMLVKGDKPPEPKEVKIGLEGDEFIEIISGIKLGDKVVAQF